MQPLPMKRKRIHTRSQQQDRITQEDQIIQPRAASPLQIISKNMPLLDRIRMKSLSFTLNSSIYIPSRFLKAPWVFLPPTIPNAPLLYMNVEEKTLFQLPLPHWIIIRVPHLLRPHHFHPLLIQSFHQRPSLTHVFNISEIKQINPGGEYNILFKHNWKTVKVDDIRNLFVNNAILTKDSNQHKDFGVVLICKQGKELGFCINGASKGWIELGNVVYKEIICSKNVLYGFYYTDHDNRIWFDAWDLQLGKCFNRLPPRKRNSITAPPNIGPRSNNNNYLVKSKGDVLLRSIGWSFRVYKLDLEGKTWTEVDSLGDRSLLIEGNRSSGLISTKDFRTCKRNSIYFMNEGGSILIYSLEDGNYCFSSKFGLTKTPNQPACWLLPSSD